MAVARAQRRLHRLEPAALRGMMMREVVNFSSFWRSSTFSSTVDPTIYLLAFGFGFGSLVSTVAGYSYIDFVGTGIVATTVLFAGAFPAMYSTFVKYEFQHTYDAILAAPVDTEELVTGEALWIGARTGIYGCVPMLVAVVFGLDPSWGMLLVPAIAGLAGLGWACFGIFIAAKADKIESFSYWQSGLLTPMFLVAGTFFPLDDAADLGAGARQRQSAVPLRRARSPCGLRLRGLEGRRAPRVPDRVRARLVAPRGPLHGAQADPVRSAQITRQVR